MLRELLVVAAVALAVSWLLKTFLVQAFFIPSESMEGTLLVGDRILVEKLTPDIRDIERGEVVVFADPGGWLTDTDSEVQEPAGPGDALRGGVRDGLEFLGVMPAATGHDLVKRVIGVGGDRVVCCDSKGRITVNGKALREPYLYRGDAPSEVPFDVRVPAGRLWVMGDHRSYSQDSRFHQQDPGGGFVPVDDVVGRALVVVWPVQRTTRLTLAAPQTA